MKRGRASALAAALAVCMAGGVGVAADTGRDAAASAATRGTSNPDRRAGPEMRLSKLLDMDIENADGKDVGEIRDVIVEANNGRVHYAVLEYGGFMGMGEKLFPFPLTTFRVNADGDELVLDIPADSLRKAPGFNRDRWPDWNAGDYRKSIDRHYRSGDERIKNARFIRGSELLDADLRSKDGERIGEVEDVVANIATGQVDYVVVEFEPGWFAGDKLVALPLRAFEPIREKGVFTTDLALTVDKSRLQNAPAFKRGDWPDAESFRRNVDQYWGAGYGTPSSETGPRPVTAGRQPPAR
jgi:sporulation protein YlmC with PRC-barrel domain